MKTGDFYYLVMVLGAFALFGVSLAANSLQYRSWLKRQPVKRR